MYIRGWVSGLREEQKSLQDLENEKIKRSELKLRQDTEEEEENWH